MFAATSLLVSLAIVFVASVNGQCYSNTTEILVQQTLATAEERKVYTLCPNTVFHLGPTTTPGKQSPLVARSNTHFLCGSDGSSANNCVLSGGESQFWSNEDIFDGESVATAVVVQGITFEDAQHVAILLESAGEVTFIDCIIRNQVNAAPVLANYSPLRRGLVSNDIYDNDNGVTNDSSLMIRGGNHRQTQAGGASSSAQQLNVNFIDCRFEGNRQRNPPAIFTYGVITVATHNHNINVRSCAFVENEYDTAEMGYIIRSYGAPIQIYNSCFRDNKLTAGSYGAVEVFSVHDVTSALEAMDNFGSHSGGEAVDETLCSFAAVSETIPELDRQVTCLPFDGDTCPEEPPETKPDEAATPPMLPPPAPPQLPPPTIAPTQLQRPLETPDDSSSQHVSVPPTKSPPTISSSGVVTDNESSSYKKPTGSARSMTSRDYKKRGKRSSLASLASSSSSSRNYNNNSKGRSISNSHYSKGNTGTPRDHHGGRSGGSSSGKSNTSVMTSSSLMMMAMSNNASGGKPEYYYQYKSKKMESSNKSSMKMKMGSDTSSKSRRQEHVLRNKKKPMEFY